MSDPKVLGHRDGVGDDDMQIADWQPLTAAAAAALSPLPEPPPRPSLPQRSTASPASAPASPPAPDQPAWSLPPRSRPPRPDWIDPDSVHAQVWDRPEDAAHAVRWVTRDGQEEDGYGLPPYQRVAILAIALGDEVFSEMLKCLGDGEIEEITQAVTRLISVTPEMQSETLQWFGQLLADRWGRSGGTDFARFALERALGPRKAKEILDRVVGGDGAKGFYMLKEANPADLAPYLAAEHPQTTALVLAQVDCRLGAAVLGYLPSVMQADVARRIATMGHVTPTALNEVGLWLESSLRNILHGNLGVGGPKVLADLLNMSSTATEKAILEELDSQDGAAAEQVRNLMFVFADIEKLFDHDLLVLLKECEFDDWAVALKSAPDALKNKIAALDEALWKRLAEAMEELGPMPLPEVEGVQLRIVQQIRQLEAQGKVTVVRGANEDSWV